MLVAGGLSLEEGHAIGPRADVGTDDPADLRDEVTLHAEPCP
jgi:hypothetical protein